MPTIHVQLALTFDESSVQAITQVLGPALKQALTPTRTEAETTARAVGRDEGTDARRLKNEQNNRLA